MKEQLISFLLCVTFLLLINCEGSHGNDGYRLWLEYNKITDNNKLQEYQSLIDHIIVTDNSPILKAASEELTNGLSALLNKEVIVKDGISESGSVIIANASKVNFKIPENIQSKLSNLGKEGYLIMQTQLGPKVVILIAANSDIGVLYGSFRFLQLIQTHQPLKNISITSQPKIQIRMLNHWDNLDRKVERGYAGFSLWKWSTLPDYIDPRYKDYARANASIGINGTAITNVNSNALVLTPEYLEKVAALANVFRPYGIKIYLTARFSAPVEIGNLETADPLDEDVIKWWGNKVNEIYKLIPDFGGFLVKANSEGQPGPQNYGRSHADGANLLAAAVEPHGGIIMWRAFVYSNEEPEDRAKQAYNEFKPLDEEFKNNVLIQVKNGAIDFQPREPFHPLFGALTHTPIMMEFQVTQEYLGQDKHLTYLAPLYKECLNADTYAKGEESFVSKVIDGSLYNSSITGMAGVSNIGDDRNWCGHPIAQSNWFALGRLAWNPEITSEEIAEEWIRMTYSNNKEVIDPMLKIMMVSREAGVNYRTPLGLHHQMAWHHHYGPGPWIKDKPRADWTSVYYNKADETGIGFDRTKTGSDAVSQFSLPDYSMFSAFP